VAVSDSTAVVGASGRTSGAGAAYVFGRTWTTWTLDAVLGASDQASNDRFGSSVAISGSTAVVGASGRNSGAGAVYVFVDAKKWVQRAEITASDGAPADAFAASVALAGTTMLASAPGKDANTGALYAFTGSGPTWSQTWELAASHGEAGDLFGASVALSRSLAVAGAPGAVGATGAVWLYNLPKG
jgi:hypothetical protein